MEDDESFRRSLLVAKETSVAHLLIRTARLLNEQGLRRVRAETDFADARAAHLTVFPHLDLEGTRLTELARRMGITKQAVSQLVDELERLEVVCRQPDPEDRRAKRVVFTDHGRAMMLDGLSILKAIEGEVLAGLNETRRRHLQEDLLVIMGALESMPSK